jgi:rubrerythrin
VGDTAERIAACIAVENAIASVYNDFSNMFAEARDFFGDLSSEEVNHATVLEVAAGYNNAGKLPPEAVPVALPHIDATLNFIAGVREKIKRADVTLEQALDMALAMETSKAESYLLETLTKDTDEKVISKLRKLLVDERSHIEKIKEFMKRLGA